MGIRCTSVRCACQCLCCCSSHSVHDWVYVHNLDLSYKVCFFDFEQQGNNQATFLQEYPIFLRKMYLCVTHEPPSPPLLPFRSPPAHMLCRYHASASCPELQRLMGAQKLSMKLRGGFRNTAIFNHQILNSCQACAVYSVANLEMMAALRAVPRCFSTLQRSSGESSDCTLKPGHLLLYKPKKKRNK